MAVIGAGPGGLTAAMILARRGFDVVVCEKEAGVGGRNGELRTGDYSHDIGPTFLMMKFVLDQVFRDAGRESADYLDFVKLDPMYELGYQDDSMFCTSELDKMRSEVARVFPGQEAGFDRFLVREAKRFFAIYPTLQKDFSSLTAFLSPSVLKAVPHLSATKSLYDVLASYFDPELLRLSFSFQSKYLGMSPWDCPGLFMILPYIEYAYGVYHTMGGLNRISHAMAKVAEEHGGSVRCSAPVKRVITARRRAVGIELESGETIEADDIVINADFAHAMTTLFEPGMLRTYTEAELRRREYSCSTFMLYLGVDKKYDASHHAIYFAKNYKANLRAITEQKVLPEDFSFYIRNASVLDPTIAPEGHSSVYILVPIANQCGTNIDWEKQAGPFRDRVLEVVEQRTPFKDLRKHIVEETVLHPGQWESERSIFYGATFNLSHRLGQMLYFRPHNRFEEIRNCWLVGGGTHPGSGLPTIYESGRIAANLISKRHGIPFDPPPALPPR